MARATRAAWPYVLAVLCLMVPATGRAQAAKRLDVDLFNSGIVWPQIREEYALPHHSLSDPAKYYDLTYYDAATAAKP